MKAPFWPEGCQVQWAPSGQVATLIKVHGDYAWIVLDGTGPPPITVLASNLRHLSSSGDARQDRGIVPAGFPLPE